MAYGDGPRHRNAPQEFYTATCADCGKECEIPFKPTQGRPVYCRDCYRRNRPEKKKYNKPRF